MPQFVMWENAEYAETISNGLTQKKLLAENGTKLSPECDNPHISNKAKTT